MYAVIDLDGRQHKVEPGTELEVNRVNREIGESFTLEDAVLFVNDGEQTTVGDPTVTGANVDLEVLDHFKGEKVSVFKMKQKTRYRRRQGHRQPLSKIRVKDVNISEAS